jgi:hypothetical protein
MIAAPVHHPRPGCQREYTVRASKHAIDRTFTGTRNVHPSDYRRLRMMVRCQRNVGARPYVRWVLRNREAAWKARRNPPVVWNSPAIASWYDDSGTTGCGFHATYGIATFVVPCGGHVTLRHGSSTVTATRDDSGPYISGRTFDLNPTVKAALGCSDLCDVMWR